MPHQSTPANTHHRTLGEPHCNASSGGLWTAGRTDSAEVGLACVAGGIQCIRRTVAGIHIAVEQALACRVQPAIQHAM